MIQTFNFETRSGGIKISDGKVVSDVGREIYKVGKSRNQDSASYARVNAGGVESFIGCFSNGEELIVLYHGDSYLVQDVILIGELKLANELIAHGYKVSLIESKSNEKENFIKTTETNGPLILGVFKESESGKEVPIFGRLVIDINSLSPRMQNDSERFLELIDKFLKTNYDQELFLQAIQN